ncbi:VOC family protein [Nocardioides sp. NPDC127503]|uniref:VOC family protein n=1 Tax=Nocardioides sp. NPDC127503 TaxID=3154516 RepID=UPI0033178F51
MDASSGATTSSLFGFGGAPGRIIQSAFVVPDLDAAVERWVGELRTGPWFLFDHFPGEGESSYRGGPSSADVSIAMAFTGNLQIELIQPNDDAPSVYRETIERRGHGFHHHGIASEDVEADIESYLDRGFHIAYRADVPTGGQVVYLDGGSEAPGFIELIPASPAMDELFTEFWKASIGWDGTDPTRRVG